MNVYELRDPFKLHRALWPREYLYSKAREMIRSFWDNKETYVYAGNMLGKDWTFGRVAVMAYLTRHPCRGLTTSASGRHLGVLWGEMRNAINTAAVPLSVERGGPLLVLHNEVRKVYGGQVCPLSYLKGMVAADQNVEALQGHHIAKTGDGEWRTFAMGDEASALRDAYRTMMMTWANRGVWFGNPWDCNNWWRKARAAGDVHTKDGKRCLQKIIHVRAEDSPNVQLGLKQRAAGVEPTDEMLVPGLLSFSEYEDRRQTYDEEQQCVSLDGMFYEGGFAKLFLLYLAQAKRIADELRGLKRRGTAVGVDTGEGSANTSFTVGDRSGVLDQRNWKTPDTSVIAGELVEFGREWGVEPENWLFDRGGGGYQIACEMRSRGYNVRTVGFGQGVLLEPKYGSRLVPERMENVEEKGAYKNRRAQMYGEAAEELMRGYGVPAELAELHRQLSLVPKQRDEHGKLKLPPKHRRKGDEDDPNNPSMTELVGRSPDEMDSFVLMLHGVRHPAQRVRAGAA